MTLTEKIIRACAWMLLPALCLAASTYNYFAPGGALSCTGACTAQSVNLSSGAFITGNLPTTNLASIAGQTTLANVTTSAGTPTAANPLAVANMMAASISVDVSTNTNITLSGTQTIDGIAVGGGQTVLVTSQTSSVNNGIYVSSNGAWTRAANFPAGFVVSINCDLVITIRQGTARGGHTFDLITTSAVTIGTSLVNFVDVSPQATTVKSGFVTITGLSNQVPSLGTAPNAANDCVGFNDTAGSVGDIGNAGGATGFCVVSDANGNPIFSGNGGPGPTVTGTGCSAAAGVTMTNASGAITATGIDTCTLVFAGTGTPYAVRAPNCSVGNIGATVLASLASEPTTAHAIFNTTAAGTFNYVCL